MDPGCFHGYNNSIQVNAEMPKKGKTAIVGMQIADYFCNEVDWRGFSNLKLNPMS